MVCQPVIRTPILQTFSLKNVLATSFFLKEEYSFQIVNLGILEKSQDRSKHVYLVPLSFQLLHNQI